MTTSCRLARDFDAARITFTGPNRIQYEGKVQLTEDELRESIWLINMELHGACLTKRERIESHRQIAEYNELLRDLRRWSAGA